MKIDLLNAMAGKLQSSNRLEQDYIFEYFFPFFVGISDKPSISLASTIKEGLKKGDIRFYNALIWIMESENYKLWKAVLKPEYDSFKEVEPQHDIHGDEIPF